MAQDRVKFQDVLASQVPEYVKDDFPLLVTFLEEYYKSQEIPGGTFDLIQNLDSYVKTDELFKLDAETILQEDIDYNSTTIKTGVDKNFTYGFPDQNGLIKIDDEIISYEVKTDTTFENCKRGFSGITSYIGPDPDKLVFQTSLSTNHKKGTKIQNLNVLFLQQFFKKLKRQVVPGFQDRKLVDGLDQRNFIFGSDSFYSSKGTDASIEILFRALYGKEAEVILPSRFLIRPSDADYRISKSFIVESYVGDPLMLHGKTLYQPIINFGSKGGIGKEGLGRGTGPMGTLSGINSINGTPELEKVVRGSVCNVERLNYDKGQYYQISVDYGYDRDSNVEGSVYGSFQPNPKTQVVNSVAIGATIIDVDSTVGFPDTGSLSIFTRNNDELKVSYTSRNVNQFIGISTTNISAEISDQTAVRYFNNAFAFTGIGTEDQIKVRMTSTLKDLELKDPTRSLQVGDTIDVKSLGLPLTQKKSTNWFYNVKSQYDVSNVEVVDLSEAIYKITLKLDHFFKTGYLIRLISSDGVQRQGNITKVNDKKSFSVKLSSIIPANKLAVPYTATNLSLKGNSSKYPALQNSYSNVQTVYNNFDKDVIVASNSLPFYSDTQLNPYDKAVKFSGKADSNGVIEVTSTTDHGFYTGDSVFYKGSTVKNVTTTPDGFQIITTTENKFTNMAELVYFVRRVSATKIQIAKSKSDLFSGKYIIPAGAVQDNQFIYYDFYNKQLKSQYLYRQFLKPDNQSGVFDTEPGYNGMLINGTEILNFKSPKSVYYGKINSISIQNQGEGYDVINPPALSITDTLGVGATGTLSVSGSLERVDIVDVGYDYVDNPVVRITGGFPTREAVAEVNISSVGHSVEFNAGAGSTNVTLDPTNTIGFSTFHKFRDNEKIIYNTEGTAPIVGLSTNSYYYVKVIDAFTVQLHPSKLDAISGINTISMTRHSDNTHSIDSFARKKTVTSVIVVDPGEGYKNNRRNINPAGIITALNCFVIDDHGYSTRDIIRYTPEKASDAVVGLNSITDYIVKSVNKDTIKLYEVGAGSTLKNYYFDNDISVSIGSTGTGSFNYEPINMSIEGTVGVNSLTNQDFTCKVTPVFRGSVTSADVISKGVGYGSSTILNFDRQPSITFESGTSAQLFPVVSNGKIIDVIIQNPGTGYNSPPDLNLVGVGSYCKLTPVIDNGSIVSIKIISGGIGYDQGNIRIDVKPSGNGATAEANINEWNVDVFANDFNNIDDDDGFIDDNLDSSSLQYSHVYAPRKLRESVDSVDSNGNTLYGSPDLVKENGVEVNADQHSPIIGWAYDGNPIYGPFGYSNGTGGSVKQMISGYELVTSQAQRPPVSVFREGFFVEDYIYRGTGDLDEHNGRTCVTPEYPNGVYAYFATFDTRVDTSGPFDKFKRPAFPYLIGPSFKSKPNNFNFKKSSNQLDYPIGNQGYLRNTVFYNISANDGDNKYIFNPNRVSAPSLEINAASSGSIDNIGIVTGGTNYKIGDKIFFDTEKNGRYSARGSVDQIAGKSVHSVSIATTTVENIEYIPYQSRQQFIGMSSSPHGFKNDDILTFNSQSEYFDALEGKYRIGVSTSNFVLTEDIGNASVTGINTFIPVSGPAQYHTLVINDILEIGSERVKVLNIEPNRLRVAREQDGTTSTAHTATSILSNDPRRFTIRTGAASTTKILNFNKELYFIPSECVGIGSTTGTGIGVTLTISNPGAGVSQVFVEPRSIFIPNHGLRLNDKLRYNINGGGSITYWDGISGTPTSNLTGISTIYAVPLSKDTVGISSNLVGVNTIGKYVGVNTTAGLLYLIGNGSGNNHSFKTDLTNVITSSASRNSVIVSTAGTHGLSYKDKVNFDLKPTNTVNVKVVYDDYNRRIVFDPVDFVGGDVDLSENTITFSNNPFKTGDRVIHTASSPSGGLDNEGLYFVYLYSETKIQFVRNKSDLKLVSPPFVNLTTASAGTLSRVNPLVETHNNNTLNFDLSDQSLSFVSNGVRYSAFEMQIFRDPQFNDRFLTSGVDDTFEVLSSGQPGITTTANLSIRVTENVPTALWYRFDTINDSIIPSVKSELVIDNDVKANNQIDVVKTQIDGPATISAIASTTFTYVVANIPNIVSFGSTNCEASYTTNSPNAFGSIASVRIIDGGYGFKSVPSISSIRSGLGTGGLVEATSDEIGKLLDARFVSNNIGFDYASDPTLNAVAGIPEVLKLEPLSSFKSIGITSSGINYLVSPEILVFDGITDKKLDVELEYSLGDTEVRILKNSSNVYFVPPRFVPTNNSNGYSISSITYNSSNDVVRLFLTHQFSSEADYPFEVGKGILVENISVGVGSTGSGYNSKDYNYKLFPVTGVNTNAGGSGAWVEYDLTEQLGDNGFPGNYSTDSIGRVVPETHFPIFEPVLTKNLFLQGEKLVGDRFTGIVRSYNPNNEILKTTVNGIISKNDFVRGLSSGSIGQVEEVTIFDAELRIGAGATIYEGWQKDTGFLNNNLQRIPDNEYYQDLSYSIASEIDLDRWNDPVSAMTHTAGFRKFADLQVYSSADSDNAIVSTEDSNVENLIDIISEGDLNCYQDFDRASERGEFIDNVYISNEIVFANRILSDYLQSVGNRVVEIDDISSQFNSNARTTPFEVVARYDTNYNYNKIFTYARDRTFTDERQFAIVSVLQDDEIGYISQYASIESYPYLGYFDYAPTGTGWDLLFYPVKFETNVYDVSTSAINILSDVSSTALDAHGDVAYTVGGYQAIPASTTTTIVSFGTTYRAAKVIALFDGVNDRMYGAELNIVHDGTDCYQLETNAIGENQGLTGVGFGTFDSRISGSNVIVEFTPDSSIGFAMTCTTGSILISDSNTTTGNDLLDVSRVGSSYKAIAASGSPTANVIASYDSPSESAYYLFSVKDTTNNRYEVFEFAALNSDSNECYVEWANVETSGHIGTVGVTTNATGGANIVYTPEAGIDVDVRSYFTEMMVYDENTRSSVIDIENVQITTDVETYEGTLLDVKTGFELKHDGLNIFRRVFDGTDTTIVNATTNQITLPNHFFVSGEAIEYGHPGTGATMAIQIASTTFPGIGATDKLPQNLFVIKDDESAIRFATTAENALAEPPVAIDITSVGMGLSHTINATKQNTKAIVAIDNIIQSPIAETDITTQVDQTVIFDTVFNTTGLTSFTSGDIIKVGNEFMKIEGIGIGNTVTVQVERAALGSNIGVHTSGDTITKFTGNYRINNNSLNFVEAPFGNIPLSTTTGNPNERDWTGITTSSMFQGRTFMKRAAVGSTNETYHLNHVLDDITDKFTGVGKTYTLTSGGSNVSGIDTSTVVLVNGIYQLNQGIQAFAGDYNIEESVGVSSIVFTGERVNQGYDPNRSSLPVGGRFISVGSTGGFGYQPLVAAGGTANISAGGTVQSISIGNSGSGYRAGINTVVNVGVQTYSGVLPVLTNIGTATIQGGNIVSVAITNPVTGFTSANPPIVVFDDPLSYYNVPLVYSSSSPSQTGAEATIDIIVGQGSSVIDFELNNQGYGYREGDILTVNIGGLTGIPTNTSLAFEEFQLTIDRTFSDQFNGWSVGEFEVFDRFDNEFDGVNKSFRLLLNEVPVSIKAAPGSNIDVEQTLLVFINDILQKPNEGYTFEGGSVITFSEAPKGPVGTGLTGDTSKILFYKGAGDVDVILTDIEETVKVGDTLKLNNDPSRGQSVTLDQDPRTVVGINTLDTVETNPYVNPGVTTDQTLQRPVTWCKQTVDKIINGDEIGKDRISYEPSIFPASYIIQNIGLTTTTIHVDTVKPLYDAQNEQNLRGFQNKISLNSQDAPVGASVTAIVSNDGRVLSFGITEQGSGYTGFSTVSIFVSTPDGGISSRASGIGTMTGGGKLLSASIINPGSGYTHSNPPVCLIETPKLIEEDMSVTSYIGDSGIIVGFGTTTFTAGLGTQTQVIFDFFIPGNSDLRNADLVGTAQTVSGISTGDYYTITRSNIGLGTPAAGTLESLYNDNSTILGVTTTFCDTVYQVENVTTISVNVVGVGTTAVRRVFSNVGNISTVTAGSNLITFDSTAYTFDGQEFVVYQGGISSSFNFGRFSWGKMNVSRNISPSTFNFYGEDGITGLSTSALVTRFNPLKFNNYV